MSSTNALNLVFSLSSTSGINEKSMRFNMPVADFFAAAIDRSGSGGITTIAIEASGIKGTGELITAEIKTGQLESAAWV